MSVMHTTKNKYKVLATKKRTVDYMNRFENFFSIIISMLATVGIPRTILQAIL